MRRRKEGTKQGQFLTPFSFYPILIFIMILIFVITLITNFNSSYFLRHSESKTNLADQQRVVVRVKTILPDTYHLQVGFNNKSETCVLYPRVPKAWLANGFIIVPSLSEKGKKKSKRRVEKNRTNRVTKSYWIE